MHICIRPLKCTNPISISKSGTATFVSQHQSQRRLHITGIRDHSHHDPPIHSLRHQTPVNCACSAGLELHLDKGLLLLHTHPTDPCRPPDRLHSPQHTPVRALRVTSDRSPNRRRRGCRPRAPELHHRPPSAVSDSLRPSQHDERQQPPHTEAQTWIRQPHEDQGWSQDCQEEEDQGQAPTGLLQLGHQRARDAACVRLAMEDEDGRLARVRRLVDGLVQYERSARPGEKSSGGGACNHMCR